MSSQELITKMNKICSELTKLNASVTELNNKIDNSEIANRTMLEMRWQEISKKFDIFANLNEQSSSVITKTSTRKISKPIFFKTLFMEDRDKHLNLLYTQEEIDMYMEHPDVVKKSKEEDKYIRIAKFIYENHIKVNKPEGRLAEFESIYTKSTTS